MHESIYEPQEDSYMLLDQVKKFAKGKVLDMGTGSGILAFGALKKAKWVLALDINPNAVEFVENLTITQKIKNLLARDSNLFSFLENNFVDFSKGKFTFKFYKNKNTKFDTIIFNPPYLPRDSRDEEDVDLYVSGGKHGYEIIADFLGQINHYLETDGRVLMVFSSLTKKDKIDQILENNLLEHELVDTRKIPWEELYCYKITKSKFLQELEKKGIVGVQKFAKGHRGFVYVGNYNGKTVIIKRQRPDIKVKTIANEIKFLKLLNKKKLAQKVMLEGKDYFVYEFIEGQFIKRFMYHETKDKLKKVLLDVLDKMYNLDKLGINKEEMHHPHKHVIIDKKLKCSLIDFERANYSKKPKNVTQFVQYITTHSDLLDKKKFKIDVDKLRKAAQEYKADICKDKYDQILKLVN